MPHHKGFHQENGQEGEGGEFENSIGKLSGAEREVAEDPEEVEEDKLIGENGELREQMKWMND